MSPAARRAPIAVLLAALLLLWASAVQAAVRIDFQSKEFGATFPHAFVVLEGTLDDTGEPVDASYGFTAVAVTPALLMGSVRGKVEGASDDYIAASDVHFSMTLSDDQYRVVMAVVARWRDRAQPSYNLNSRNCIHFVGEVAESLGLTVAYPKKLMKKPRSFLIAVRTDNEARLAGSPPPVLLDIPPIAPGPPTR